MTTCFEERTCGLCGVWDGDTSNDFTYVDCNSGNTLNTDGSVYSTEDVSDIFLISESQWIAVQSYGNEWIDEELNGTVHDQQGDCATVSTPPEKDCLARAREICEDGCICKDYAHFYWYTWVINCAFDACAMSRDTIDDNYPDSSDNGAAIAQGYFDRAMTVMFCISFLRSFVLQTLLLCFVFNCFCFLSVLHFHTAL